MANVTLGGNPITVNGNFPKKGDLAADFTLTGKDLKEVSLKDFPGKKKVLNIVPSLDTPVCQTSTKKFNEKAAGMSGTVVLVISGDLPFAMGRFCTAENIANVTPLSTFRNRDFLRQVWRGCRRRTVEGSHRARRGGARRQQPGAACRASARNHAGTQLRCCLGLVKITFKNK